MHIHSSLRPSVILLALLATLGGCADHLVDVRPGSDSVALAEAAEVNNCTSKGSIQVSVLSEVGFITRSNDAVEGNLLQLARNGAINAGGNTVVKGSSMEFGKRSFDIYQCPRP